MSAGEESPARILIYGDERLRQRCREVGAEDQDLASLAENLWRLMQRHRGVGLAAPQLGDPRRLIVVQDRRSAGPPQRLVLVNPRVHGLSADRCLFEEGCLSFPGLYLNLARPRTIRLEYDDLRGRRRRLTADGLLSRIIQHELDHLDGVLFSDHLSVWRRWSCWWRLYRLRKSGQGERQ